VIRRFTAFPVEEVHQNQAHVTLHIDSRRWPVVRRVGRQAQESWFQIKARTLCHARRHEASTWRVNLQLPSLERGQRTPPASAEDGKDRKRRRKASLNPWSTSDFSRARIEDHYELSHPKMWGKPMTRVVAAEVMSAAVVQQFYNMSKLEAHLRRVTAGRVKITISSLAGKLISSLYDHSISTINRPNIHPLTSTTRISELHRLPYLVCMTLKFIPNCFSGVSNL
jgi:hypothetical protein